MTGPSPLRSAPDLEASRVAAEIAGEGTDPFAAAVRSTHMPMIVTDPRRPDNPVVFANDAFCRLTGYARAEVLGRNCRFLQGPDTKAEAIERVRAAVRAVEPLKVDLRNYRKNGEPFWNRLMLAPVRDAAGVLAYFVASQVDVTLERERLDGLQSRNAALIAELDERLRAQEASEARLRLATQAARLGIWELDARTRRLEASPECIRQFGGDPQAPFGVDAWLAAMHSDERERVLAAVAHAIRTRGDLDVEIRVLVEGTASRWLALRAQAVGDLDAFRLTGVSQDITARREAELRLAFSEESLRLATEAAEIGSWDLHVPTDVLTWSDRTRGMFGISPGVPCSMADFYAGLHPDDLAATGAAFASALDPAVRATYDVEYRTIGRDDHVTRWVAAKGRALFDANGVCVRALGTAIDITARKTAEGRAAFLVELWDRLRGLTAPDAIVQAAVGALGRHLGAARAGYGQVQADDATIVLETGHVDGVAPLSGAFRVDGFGPASIARQRLGVTVVCDDVRADGSSDPAVWAAIDTRAYISVPLVRDGRFQASLFVNRREPYAWPADEVRLIEDVAARIWDAIARARAEAGLRDANASLERQVADRTAALHANEARLRAVFDTSYQLQGLLDADGLVLDANPTLLALLQLPIEEVRGRPFWSTPWFAATEGLSAKIEAAVAAVAQGESVRLELAADTPAGRRAFDVSLRPVRDVQGRVTGMVPEAIDITDRLDAEEQLRQSQKMEAVGQLTGGIAHDFNNLLMGVIGSLEMLQRRVNAGRSDGVERYVAAATTSAQRAAALTQRLLAFARRQPLDPRRVDANRLIAGMEDLLRRTLGAAIELDIVEGVGLWPILCDPNQLESAVLNLVINARDAMPDGGRVTISTANAAIDAASGHPRGDALPPGDYAVISIADTGVGMPPQVVSKIFDPFFTTKPIGQGTGLGLSMVYGFVRQSNGAVRVESDPGAGTVFALQLPRFEGRAADAEPAHGDAAPSPRARAGEAVLVVEDEPAVRTLVVETLHGLGYAALEAADGPQGLRILQSNARVDLLVTDVGLPGLNGRRLADAARVLRPDLKVLFMTGFVHDADVGGGGELEAGTEVLSKPFALDVLATRVRGMIAACGGDTPRA